MKLRRIFCFITTLLILFFGIVVKVNAKATFTLTSIDTVDLGYGVTYDIVKGTSTSTYSSTTMLADRKQMIFTVNVPKESKASVVVWGISKANNAWGSYTLQKIAADYEAKHPDKKVLAATNNWLSDTKSNNIGELDGAQVYDGQNFRVSDKQGTTSETAVTFTHGYIARPHFLGFDQSGKNAYFSDDWNNGNNYTDKLMLSFYNGYDEARTMLNLPIDKINQAPSDGEIAIVFPNYTDKIDTSNATIYKMKAESLRYDMEENSYDFVERDAFAKGTLIGKVSSLDFSDKTLHYYLVSKNATFDDLDLTNKTLLAQYELQGDYANVVGGTPYYYRIVKDGEVYPEGHQHEINDEVHPRTAFVVKEDGSFAISVIDGRNRERTGMEYMEMAHFYKTMYDGYNVFNYDGGGSSAMIVTDGKGGFNLVNAPTDGRQRSVANATMIVVDRDPYKVTHEEVLEHEINLKITEVSENVEKVFVNVNGVTKEFINGVASFTDIPYQTTYWGKTSYKLKNGKTYEGGCLEVRTCGQFATIKEAYVDKIGYNSATFNYEVEDLGETYLEIVVEINGEKIYNIDTIGSVELKNLQYNTEYDLLVYLHSDNGTSPSHKELYEYSFTTTMPKFPIEISLEVDNMDMYVGDAQKISVIYDPIGTTTRLEYESNKPEVATVSSTGRIKAIAKGSATITVTTREGVTEKLVIHVYDKLEPEPEPESEPTPPVTPPTPEPEKKGCKKSVEYLMTFTALIGTILIYLRKKD